MHALILTWDLSANDPTIFAELRQYIAEESWSRYRATPGLVEKVWFSDERRSVFGAFYLWENEEALERELAAMYRVEQRTGVAPRVQRVDVEAIQEGKHGVRDRTAAGKAWSISGPPIGPRLT